LLRPCRARNDMMEEIASGLQASHHMQERRLLRACGARNDLMEEVLLRLRRSL